jgi:hypothetical protein
VLCSGQSSLWFVSGAYNCRSRGKPPHSKLGARLAAALPARNTKRGLVQPLFVIEMNESREIASLAGRQFSIVCVGIRCMP